LPEFREPQVQRTVMRCTRWSPLLLVDVQSLFHLGQNLVDAKAGRLRTRREFQERFQELPDRTGDEVNVASPAR
jgi:hypothetical protein